MVNLLLIRKNNVFIFTYFISGSGALWMLDQKILKEF